MARRDLQVYGLAPRAYGLALKDLEACGSVLRDHFLALRDLQVYGLAPRGLQAYGSALRACGLVLRGLQACDLALQDLEVHFLAVLQDLQFVSLGVHGCFFSGLVPRARPS